MNENQFEQFVAQMMSGMKSATDWTVETQRREIEAHDHKLAAAETVLRKALDFVQQERMRLRSETPEQITKLRQLHQQIGTQGKQPANTGQRQ